MAPQTTSTPDTTTYVFSPRELQRLAAYRAAVIARFYNDECDTLPGSARSGPARKPASLRRNAS